MSLPSSPSTQDIAKFEGKSNRTLMTRTFFVEFAFDIEGTGLG